ncbi:LLM class flavin-dependent oxidoreductase [soil metagenome]
MLGGVRYGLSVPNFAEPDPLLDLARAADDAGWDGFFLWDHIVVDRGSPVPITEPWTLLAAAATATSRVRLGTLVTPVARRRPWVLARQVTTVDHLSGGRAVLGVGLGVPPEAEYAALGEPADPKGHARLLDEGLEVIDALWSGEPVDHDGPSHRVDGVAFLPRPVQRPRVPIWSAASLPARSGVRRAARWDGVAPIYSDGADLRPVTPAEVAAIVRELGEHRRGGAPFDVVVWAVAPDASRRREYEQAGATWLIEGPAPGPDWHDDAMMIASAGPPRS